MTPQKIVEEDLVEQGQTDLKFAGLEGLQQGFEFRGLVPELRRLKGLLLQAGPDQR